MDVTKAKQCLSNYQRIKNMGFAGRFLSGEYSKFLSDTSKLPDETIFDWYVRKALENLEESR